MGTKKQKKCIYAYCGQDGIVTRDHIPPKNLFPSPRPSDLITVPCCFSCHEGWSDDDEYFRAMILSSELTESHPDAVKATETFLQSLRRPQHEKFLSQIWSSMHYYVNVYTKSKLYLGVRPAIKYERDRMDRVITRIVRGLFFKETGNVFPGTPSIITAMSDQISDKMVEIIQSVKNFRPWVSAGNTVFKYTVAFVPEDQRYSQWVMFFYNRLPIIVLVQPEDGKLTDEALQQINVM